MFKAKNFFLKKIKSLIFPKKIIFRKIFLDDEKIFVHEILFSKKIKLCTVDSATFYRNPTKTPLQKNARKKRFFRPFFRSVFLNCSGSRDHAVTNPIKSSRSIATTSLLFKKPKIIQIGSRSSENGRPQTHRCSGGSP